MTSILRQGAYSDDEIQFIIDTNATLTAQQQAQQLARAYPSLRKVRARLLRQGQITIGERANRRPPTHTELDFIIATYETLSIAEQVARLPGRTERQVSGWRSVLIQEGRLDPRRRKSHRPWTSTDSDELKALISEGLKIDTIARRMNRNLGTVYQRAAELGGIDALRNGFFRVRSKTDVEQLFNVPKRVVQRWIDQHLLVATRNAISRRGNRTYRGWLISDDAILSCMENPATWSDWEPFQITDPLWREYAQELRPLERFQPSQLPIT